jgi:hypothetical protein
LLLAKLGTLVLLMLLSCWSTAQGCWILYAARAAESLGVDMRAKRALLGVWILGAANAAGVRRYAGILREAVGFVCWIYCWMLNCCWVFGCYREAAGLLNAGCYCWIAAS